jgi:phosphoribosylformylglycinamidine cyclo-ligase
LIQGIAHITGGGLIENVARILPAGLSAEFHLNSWQIPAVMTDLQSIGHLSLADMENTFNLGLGMVLAVRQEDAAKVKSALENAGETVYQVGQLIAGDKKVIIRED